MECEPHVVLGDMHDLDYDDNSFDFVFTNVFDHSLYPSEMISEVERVLKIGGYFLLQMQVSQEIDDYAENEIQSVDDDIVALFENSDVVVNRNIPRNINIRSDTEQTKQTKKTCFFFKPCSITKIF